MTSSSEGSTRSNYLCMFLGTSHILNSLVCFWISSEISGDGGQRAWAACACAFSRFSNSAARVLLRMPTPGAGFCCARHVPLPLLLPGFVAVGGVSDTTSVAVSGAFVCARGVECRGTSVWRCTVGGSFFSNSACLGVSASGGCLGAHP